MQRRSLYSCALVLFIFGLQAAVLYTYGQPLVSKTHAVMLWAGDVLSSENSQQLSDWYSFSHIIHGFIFYLGVWYFFPRLSIWQRLAIAVGIEAGWEMLENTPMVIDHYRQQALAQGYTGDSVINSLSDTVMMIVGFLAAWRLPILVTIVLAIGFELFTGYFIHDGLLLNIIGMFWTPDFIANWQAVGM